MNIVYAHTPSVKYINWCPTARFQTQWCNAWPDTFSLYCCVPNSATLLKQYKVKQVCNFRNPHSQPGKEILYNIKKLQRLYLLCMRLYPCFTFITQHHNRKYGELHSACILQATDSSKVSASLHMNICTIYSRQFGLLKKRHSDKNLNQWEEKDFFSIMLQMGQRYWGCISKQYANALCTGINNHIKSCSLAYSSHFIFLLSFTLQIHCKMVIHTSTQILLHEH